MGDNVTPMTEGRPEAEGQMVEMVYLPLPINKLEYDTIGLHNTDTQQMEVFVRMLYQDIGGEKPLWFTPDMAVEVGEELVRLGQGAKIGGKVPSKPKIWTPS